MTLATYLDETWELPAFYAPAAQRAAAVRAEYDALTSPTGVVIADRSWRDGIGVDGSDRQTFLQGMISNDVGGLKPGQGCRAALLNPNAQMLADLDVYVVEDRVVLSMDPRCMDRVRTNLDKFLIVEDVRLSGNLSQVCAIITVMGGAAAETIRKVMGVEQTPEGPYANVPLPQTGAMIARSGQRGAPSFDLWLDASDAAGVWEALIAAGASPVGHEAVEIAHVEAGDPAWGTELTETLLFPEAEVSEAISYRKGCYVGQEIIARLHARGHTNRSLRGILFEPGPHSMQYGDLIYPDTEDLEPARDIGRITSAVPSPRFDGRILALAYVRKEHADAGSRVICRYAHRSADGVVLVPPFEQHAV